MLKRVIDDAGKVWEAASPLLSRHLGYPQPDFDLIDYAVRNLGCVTIRSVGNSCVLRIGGGGLSRRTIDAIIRLVAVEPPQRFVFETGEKGRYFEVIGNLNDAIARLEDFAAEAAVRQGTLLLAEELALDRLAHPKRAKLRRLHETWLKRRGRLERKALIEPFVAAELASRSVIARVERDQPRLEFIGARLNFYDPGWTDRAIGRPLDEQPDPGYGQVVAEAYRDVAREGGPRYELLDVLIHPPGRPVQRSRYERLLLPWRTSDGTTVVSGSSLLRTRFSIGSAK